MRKESLVQNILLGVLAVAVIGLTVAFAAFSSNVKVEGEATFSYAKWEIAFDPDSFDLSDDSLDVDATFDTSNTTLSYAVTLDPGEVYEFDVNVKNSGTFNANLKTITFGSGQDPTTVMNTYKYVNYVFEYDGVEYKTNQTGLALALNKGTSKPIHVKVEYVLDENNPENLQVTKEEGEKLNFTVTLGYEQAS